MQRRPKRSGMILRLTDLVFILLFGFISIAQLSAVKIELPKTKKRAADESSTMSFTLSVGEGWVKYKDQDAYPLPGLEVQGTERKQSIDALAGWIGSLWRAAATTDSLIQIRPERSSMMQNTIDVYDACRDLDVRVAIIAVPESAE